MDENYGVQQFDVMDTTPETSDQETTNDTNFDEDGIVTPNDAYSSEENVNLDADEISAQNSASKQENASEPFVSVQYNHEKRDFTKQEAINFIQKGMHTESLRTKLEFLAQERGVDVNTLVENIISAPEMAYRRHLEDLYGKDSENVEIGMSIFRQKQSEEYRKIAYEGEKAKNNKDINTRLADEYLSLKQDIPDAPKYSELPDFVIMEAAEGKRDLTSAYLRYLYKEKMKTTAAKKTQDLAASASSGTMEDKGTDNTTSEERNFLSGLWGR